MIGTQLGNFEIIDEIGRGGMGVVYRARQTSLDRIVALKVLPPEFGADETSAERFEREALSMARLSHPNIVDVIEVGEQDGIRYFAMQYIDGESLEDLIRREGALTPERAANIASQIAEAIHHAHEQGVIHRDIKPGNILLASNGRAVVTDFGIAKAADGTSLTRTGASIGTPDYMAPEVLRGNPIDGRADVYSLGVLLFQMVTGRVPFVATTPFEVANRHLSEQPPRPSAISGHCPEWLETIILRALAKEPADRFQSAQEMASALQSETPTTPVTREFEPESVPPVSPTHTTPTQETQQQTSRIHPAVWAVAGAGIILILAAVGIFAGNVRGNGGNGIDGNGGPLPPPKTVQVPDVERIRWEKAVDLLKEAGLQARRLDEHDDQVERKRVIRQQPASSVRVEVGSTVTLVVSEGPDFAVQVGQIAVYRDRDGDDLNMRREPWGPIVGQLPYGGRIEVLEINTSEHPGWVRGRALASGREGWLAVRNPDDGFQLLYPDQ